MDIVLSVLESLHFSLPAFLCQVVLFFVLHFTLNGLVYGPIMDSRNKRDGEISGRLAEAEALTIKARQLKDDFDSKVRQARTEGQAMVQEELDQAEKARQEKVAAARAKAKEILDKARAEAAEHKAEALKTLDQQIDNVAVAIASKLLSGSLAEKDAQPLLAKLGGNK